MVLTEEERRERRRISRKKFRQTEKGKEKKRISNKKYLESKKGKEIRKYNTKKYKQTEKGKKLITKCSWKSRGLNMENFEEIYERYTMAIFCDICECVLEGNGRNRKCMDHDHDNGEFRNIVCSYCNIHICK